MASRLQDVIQRGTRANQPLATAVSAGTLYFVTDEEITERSSGSAWESYSPTIITPSGPKSISLLTAGTGATYTVPAGITSIIVEVIGGGGGGGGGDTDGVGGGGGAGAYARKVYNVSPSDTFLYSIGASGAGGLAGNNAGSTGGSTTFDNGGAIVTAPGGNGGASMASGSTVVYAGGGTSNVATGGDFNIRGGRGGTGFRFSATTGLPGVGANGMFGTAGAYSGDADAAAALGYGAGGSGAWALASTDRAGGDGSIGVIIVTEFGSL